MTDHQIRRRDDIRPLASIPNKEGAIIIGVHKNGTEAPLKVFMDRAGNYTVLGYADLTGWRLPR